MMTDFDKFKSIHYEPIQKLFWDTFPYKVSLNDQYERPTNICVYNDPIAYTAWKDYRIKRGNFYKRLRRGCPESGWKAMDNGTSFSFFFEDRDVALAFIASIKSMLAKSIVPKTQMKL